MMEIVLTPTLRNSGTTEDEVLRELNTQRGFPDGFSMEFDEKKCEELSPGIVKAQAVARCVVNGGFMIPATIEILQDGSMVITGIEGYEIRKFQW